MTMGLCCGGKFRLVRPGVVAHWCPGCGAEHAIDIHAQSRNGHVTGWDGTFDKPTIGEPVRHETERGICEYLLRGGVLYFLESSTHGLAGESRHLPDYRKETE
jgi:hypothetical protein